MKLSAITFLFLVIFCCGSADQNSRKGDVLKLIHDREAGTISVFRAGDGPPLLVQHAHAGVRPYIHPIMSPDGQSEITEYSPVHHKHQTGLYWGLKQVNGRDYFMNWKEDYWRKVSAEVLDGRGTAVRWRTSYHLLDERGDSILTETQTWTFKEHDERFLLDLTWSGKAIVDISLEKFYVGGLFVRMPWRKGIDGDVVNAVGQRNGEAEGQRAIWNDIGIRIPGQSDMAHIALLDHPDNKGFPIPWRVDNELGVGPSRQILGNWTIGKGETEVIRYRLIIYTGDREADFLNASWKTYVCE